MKCGGERKGEKGRARKEMGGELGAVEMRPVTSAVSLQYSVIEIRQVVEVRTKNA